MTGPTMDVGGRHVVVLGAGRSGLAAAELLVSRGARVTVSDAAPAPAYAERLRAAGVGVELGPHPPALLASADLIVASPGVPLAQPAIAAARAAGVPIVGEVELASWWLAGRIIAITGTKGKSTTTTLAARMLQEAGFDAPAGGNIGAPLSAQVPASRRDTLHVVEVSSFQLETTATFHPWIAVLLNLSPDHLDRHATFDEYRAAKARIFANQTPADWAVVNADDAGARATAGATAARRLDFALDSTIATGVTVDGDAVVRRDGATLTRLVPLDAVSVPGRHLLADVLAAAAVGALAGAPPEAMERAVRGFHGLEHALELVAEVDGVRYVNDSKATNVAAAGRALESFEGGIVAIMGGRYKGGRFEDLRDAARARVRAVVAIGEARPLLRAAFEGVTEVREAESMAEAVRIAAAAAPRGGVVLLAPACSSFDMFVDYAARGRAFKDQVRRLQERRE